MYARNKITIKLSIPFSLYACVRAPIYQPLIQMPQDLKRSLARANFPLTRVNYIFVNNLPRIPRFSPGSGRFIPIGIAGIRYARACINREVTQRNVFPTQEFRGRKNIFQSLSLSLSLNQWRRTHKDLKTRNDQTPITRWTVVPRIFK